MRIKRAKRGRTVWKQRIVHEMVGYYTNVAYLTFFFGVFTWYRRLILAEYQIIYLNYGVAFIEALVLAKVIMIGDVLRLGRGLEDRPLIYPTLYKALMFSAFVGAFSVVERMIGGILRGKGLSGGIEEIVSKGGYEMAARCLVMFFAFIPFFVYRELERVLGEGKIRNLLFRRRAAAGPGQQAM